MPPPTPSARSPRPSPPCPGSARSTRWPATSTWSRWCVCTSSTTSPPSSPGGSTRSPACSTPPPTWRSAPTPGTTSRRLSRSASSPPTEEGPLQGLSGLGAGCPADLHPLIELGGGPAVVDRRCRPLQAGAQRVVQPRSTLVEGGQRRRGVQQHRVADRTAVTAAHPPPPLGVDLRPATAQGAGLHERQAERGRVQPLGRHLAVPDDPHG